MTRRVRDCLGC